MVIGTAGSDGGGGCDSSSSLIRSLYAACGASTNRLAVPQAAPPRAVADMDNGEGCGSVSSVVRSLYPACSTVRTLAAIRPTPASPRVMAAAQ